MTIAGMMLAEAMSSGPAHLGQVGPGPVSLVRVVASLAICLLVALLAILLVRQRSGKIDLSALLRRMGSGSGRLEIVETHRLGAHAEVCLLREDGREYLLLIQAGSSRVLRETVAEPMSADAPSCA